MIPTREQIEADWANPRFTPETTALIWLRTMRDEIDNLQKVYELTHDRWSAERAESNKMRRALIAIGTDVGASVNEACSTEFLCEVAGEAKSVVSKLRHEIDQLTDANTDLRDKVDDTDGRIAAMEIHGNSADHWYRKATAYKNAFSERDAALAEVTNLRHEIDRLKDELKAAHDDESEECERADRNANTAGTLRANLDKVNVDLNKANSALAKAGWTRDGAEWKPPIGPNPSPLLEQIDRLRADLDRANTEAALARDARAKASDPVREEAIRAWEKEALDDDLNGHDDSYVLERRQITAAVALMRRADGKALLRELRAWVMFTAYVRERNGLTSYQDGAVTPLNTIAKIDEMLAQPTPVEKPAAAVPVEGTSDEILQLPRDDQRWELVAQLAEFVAITLKGEVNRDEVQAIAKQLRGGA